MTMSTIQLKAYDNDEVIIVDVEVACVSQTIKTMLTECDEKEVEDDDVIPILTVNHATLKKVIEWMTYHKDDPPPKDEDKNKVKRTDDISAWDAEFLNVDQDTLFELLHAANYMDIKPLLDLICKTLANMIKGKTPEEIRSTFNMTNNS